MIAQIAQSVLTLVYVPLLFDHLGDIQFGIVLVFSSFLGFAYAADLGIGHGTLNLLSSAFVADDRQRQQVIVSSAFITVSAISLALLGLGLAISFLTDWPRLIGVSDPELMESAALVGMLFVGIFAVHGPVALSIQVRLAFQEGYVNALWQLAATAISLCLVVWVLVEDLGLVAAAFAIFAPPAIAAFGHFLQITLRTYPHLRVSTARFDRDTVRNVASVGLALFTIQLSIGVSTSLDNAVIGNVLGPMRIPEFGVPQRMYAALLGFMILALRPLWAAIADAASHGDNSWIESTVKRSVVAAPMLALPIAVLLVVLTEALVEIWLSEPLPVPLALSLGLGTWLVLGALGTAIAMVLNGLGRIRIQLIVAVATAAINLPLSIVLTNKFGISGPIWGTNIASALGLVPLAGSLFRSQSPSQAQLVS